MGNLNKQNRLKLAMLAQDLLAGKINWFQYLESCRQEMTNEEAEAELIAYNKMMFENERLNILCAVSIGEMEKEQAEKKLKELRELYFVDEVIGSKKGAA